MKPTFLLLLVSSLAFASGGGSLGGGAPEGTAVKSTAVGAGLLLGAVGDGTSAWTSVAGTGDVVGPASSVDSQIALFSSTTGKLIKAATGTGVCKATSGVASFAALVASDIPSLDTAKITTGAFPVARGGTNSATALNNNRVMVSSSGAIVEASAVTASKALCSDTNGIPVACASGPSTTTMAFVDPTSSIQTQLNGKLASAGTGLVDDRGITIETPSAATVPFGFVSYAATASTARTKCEVGSLTAEFQICHSGTCTDITGCSAVSVTTAAANTSCTAANSIAAGDYVQVIVSSPSSASMCQLGIQVVR